MISKKKIESNLVATTRFMGLVSSIDKTNILIIIDNDIDQNQFIFFKDKISIVSKLPLHFVSTSNVWKGDYLLTRAEQFDNLLKYIPTIYFVAKIPDIC